MMITKLPLGLLYMVFVGVRARHAGARTSPAQLIARFCAPTGRGGEADTSVFARENGP
jgi:hypothetical protein